MRSLTLILLTAAALGQDADLVLTGGRVVTLDEERPEVRALAITGGRVSALGSTGEIARHVGPSTQVIDLQGHLAIPGFIEGHGHFLGVGDARMQLDLMSVGSWDEVVALVAEAAGQVERAAPDELPKGRVKEPSRTIEEL